MTASPAQSVTNLTPKSFSGDGGFSTNIFEGRTVWVPTNYLYFDVPASFVFTQGVPVYVRIEYHDAGRGRLSVQYDSTYGDTTTDKYRAPEIHTRSSRVGGNEFVYSYQCFQSPRFANRQNGGTDFRLRLNSSDGIPLRIASVQISTAPYSDAQFAYVLTKPWLSLYSGPSKDFVNSKTLVGKVLAGYQGWFATPNDADDLGWRHWGRSSSVDPSPSEITVDMWPWLEEYEPDRVYPAGAMVHQDGRPAYVFSSRDPETVQRHFRWMRKHNIDGAYLQRFVSRGNSGYYGAPEFVLSNVRAAANQEGRVWAIEYDVSSLDTDPNPLEVMTNDWQFLVNQCRILDDPRYLRENGKPVLFIWGFSVTDRDFTVAQADEIVSWFTNQNLYLLGGVNSTWENNITWTNHYKKYDALLGWMERTQSDLVRQKNTLNSWGLKILPHAWPGFSWNNLKKTVYPYQYTAREGGLFYWTNLYNAVSCGADQLFLGMFDEYDEGTAIMPMSDNHPDIYDAGGTNTWGHYLDNEGLDPFWYLRLSGAGREMLNGQRSVSNSLPDASALSPVAYAGDDATAYLGPTNVADALTQIEWADGLTAGAFLGNQYCRTNAGLYVYFRIADTFCVSNALGQAATVELEYYDNVAGAVLRLHDDSLTAAYTTHPTSVTTTGTGGWKNFRWTVTNAFFGNRQNGQSDFRINITPAGKAVGLRRASVFLPEEKSGSVVAGAPTFKFANEQLMWSSKADATGWRLFQTPALSTPTWQAVTNLFTYTNGLVNRLLITTTNSSGFYRLGRPARN
ncbi:MAG: glycoside hydrolase family 71/99-like protein [Verrucomicrobia bacterium]|jgi:hypothetical protein|nr:glycoside hydrolase family 71/99-like protein [Verrucomicrobiota bacterium]